jgi:hypothetical protein
MTIMTPTRKPKRLHYEGRAAVYQAEAATKDPLWRDIVAGCVFLVVMLLGVTALLVGGLLVFG